MADSIRGTVIANGLALPNVLVKVYLAGTSVLASLFSDPSLTIPVTNDGLTGPLSEVDGSYGPFYAGDGLCDIKFLKIGYTFDDLDLASVRLQNLGRTTSTGINLVLTRQHSTVLATSAVTITVPLANTFTAAEKKVYRIINQSIVAMTTIALTGADTMTPVSILSLAPGNFIELESNGVSSWKWLSRQVSTETPTQFREAAYDTYARLNPNVPTFEARKTGAQNITGGSWTKVVFDSEIVDSHGAYDPATNYRFQPAVPGTYLIYITLGGTPNTTGLLVSVYKGGVQASVAVAGSISIAGVNEVTASVIVPIALNGGADYVEAFAFNGTGTTSLIPGRCSFVGFRIGP